MQRSICISEPQVALAGQVNTWRFIYKLVTSLKKGAVLRFDLNSEGREIDWEYPKVAPKTASNIIYMQLPDESVVYAKEVFPGNSYFPQFEFTLTQDIKGGESIIFCLGDGAKAKSTAKKESGNRAQTIVQRRKHFYLHVDPKGKGSFQEPDVFTMDIRGNDLHQVRILAPAYAVKNRRFDVIARFEDAFGNLTARAPEETLFELSYENLRENLNWKLFVPETGFITLPNFYFNEEGTYVIQLKNLNTGQVFYASPVRCFEEGEEEKSLYWGLLHGESERFDSTENIENCLRFFRDDQAFDFYGISPFEFQEETTADAWKTMMQVTSSFNEEDRFSTFIGFQYQGEAEKEGIRLMLYNKEKPLLKKKESKSNSLKKIYKSQTPKEFLSIPSFSMATGMGYNFENYNQEFERVAEIYSAWGCSEGLEKDGNLYPISSNGKNGVKPWKQGSFIDALNNNCRFGFIAGGLDDRGAYSEFYDGDQDQYTPGLTAIIAKSQSRSSMIEALYDRSCYATTGKKILLRYDIAGIEMGKEFPIGDRPGLAVNRHFNLYVGGTSPIEYIEIIRNGKVLTQIKPEKGQTVYTGEFDDMDPIEKIWLKPPKSGPEFIYYYIRVKQTDDHMAWSSPIWIDKSSGERRGRKAS
ncbi:MAG: DUF3604 domain-containing protein [Chlamydiales bacterium]|nr:DUF3604 domain-containing protein [Chlamydiales bacterium]NCF71230.1 DUF3604 domain-containing protein [Chlamydiales bacterium]